MYLRNQTLSALAAAGLSLLITAPAQADQQLTEQKIQFIQQQFDQSSQHSRYWQNGWLGFFWGTAVVQALGASSAEKDEKDDEYDQTVGAVTSLLGAGDMLLNPMQTHKFSQQLSEMPQQTNQQLDAKLAQAENWFAMAAEREMYEKSWTNHLVSAAINALAGAAIALDDNRESDGWITFATGTLVSEVKIWSAPDDLFSAQLRYQSGNYQVKNVSVQNWTLASNGPSIDFSWRF